MNQDDVRKLAARTSAQASRLAKSAGRPAARPAEPASPAKAATPASPGPVPFKPRQRPALKIVEGGEKPRPRIRVSQRALDRAKMKAPTRGQMMVSAADLFRPYKPAPGVLPKNATVAMDSAVPGVTDWAGGWVASAGWLEGQTFLGYPILAELMQRPEYRKACERLSTECTRKWIRLVSKGGDDKADRIAKIENFLQDLKLREAAQAAVFMDAGLGRAHWFLDTGDTDDPAELRKPIGNGRNKISLEKVNPDKPLKRIQVVDPTWTYAANYNASDPLKPDWLQPSTWYSMAKEVHVSRLLTFVGRPVPDLFKPSFNFGGLALTQMMTTFVNNWTNVRQHVAKIVANFSKNGIKTDLQQILAPDPNAMGGTTASTDGSDLMRRLEYYATLADNNGLLVLDKANEEFFQYNTPLGTLDQLMSQFLEQMLLPSGMPLVVFLGLTPHGLNASSEGEMLAWESWVHAYQPHFFGDNIQRVIDLAQLSIDGKLDEEIGYEWVPLRSLTEKEQGDMRKADADRDGVYLDRGVLGPVEVRQKLAKDPNSGYSGIDAEDVPEPPADEDEGGEFGEEDGAEAGAEPQEGGDRAVLPFAGDRGEWDEGKHPRDPKGKFAPTNGGGAAAWKAGKVSPVTKEEDRILRSAIKERGKDAPVRLEDVPIEALISNQLDGYLNSKKVDEYAKELAKHGDVEAPTVYKLNGHYVVDDGHHRVVASAKAGETKIKAEVTDLDAPTEVDPASFKSKREVITHLLTKGTTAADVLKATGWPSVSMPAQAAASGMKLEKYKEDGVTKYRGIPMTDDEVDAMRQARAEKRAAKMAALGKTPGLRGPRARDPQTFTLLEFLSDRGGLKPTPDLLHAFGGTNPFIPGFGRLFRKNGQSLDRAREAAVEGGYLEDAGRMGAGLSTSTVRQLLDAIDAESRGKKTYRMGETAKGPEVAGASEIDHEQEAHAMESALDQALEESGLRSADVGRKTRDRVIEIMRHEGESDPIAAWERAVMEEDQHGSDEGQFPEREDVVPGWDVPDDPGPALAPSERAQGSGAGRSREGARKPRKGNPKAGGEVGGAPF